MKFIKYFVVVLLSLCFFPLVACNSTADVHISSRYECVSWWLSAKSVNVGDEVKLAVSIDEGYEGELGVYLNGNKLDLTGGYYIFTAEKTNKIEIDGDIYKSIDRIELPHSVLLVGQDFTVMNDNIIVYYKTGDVEQIRNYEVDNFPVTTGEKKIILTFIGGDHEYRRLVDVNIMNEADYFGHIKSSFSAAIERDGVQSLLATDYDHTVFQNEEGLFYMDAEQKVWILKDGTGYVAREKDAEYLSHRFASFGKAVTRLMSYMPHLQFDMEMSAKSTYENIICSLSNVSVLADEQGNIVLSRVDIDEFEEEITREYVLDSSLSYIISLRRGDSETSIVTDTEYNTELPEGVAWKEFSGNNG